MRRGFFARLRSTFLPTAGNSFRPYILRREALFFFLIAAVLVEIAMAGQFLVQYAARDYAAAVLPSAIESFTNTERVRLHVPALSSSKTLSEAAQAKAEDMAARGYFSHQSPDGREPWDFMKAVGYDYAYAGENLAVHFYDSADVVSAWMESPTHRANIVKPVYTEIGIGIASGIYDGKETTFVVQFFGTQKKKAAFGPSVAEAAEVALSAETSPAVGQPPAVPSMASRILGAPHTLAVWILSGFLAILFVGMLLTFVVKVQIQPLDLLAHGALVSAFIGGLLVLNAQVFVAPIEVSESAAAVSLSIGDSF